MTLSVAFAEPVSAKKYKNKNSITVKVKDGKKTIKLKCKYTWYHEYVCEKKIKNKEYHAYIYYKSHDDEYGYKKGWTTEVSKFKNGEWSKFGSKTSKHKPITKIKLHS
jgi:hypothetical protein